MNEIMINGRFLSQPNTGVQRVAVEVVKALDRLIDSRKIDSGMYSFTVLADKNMRYKPDLNNIEVKVIGRYSGYIWEQFELPRYARDAVLINLCGPAPIFKRNQLAIIHDAAPFACPNEFSVSFRVWYRIMLTILCKRTAKLVTVSDFSRKELSRYCGISEKRVFVEHLGVEHFSQIRSDPSILNKLDLMGRKFVLVVGSQSPRKNFIRLAESMDILDDPELVMVVVGNIKTKGISSIEKQEKEQIKYTGRVNDTENALCFVFPSLYEGFGLPPVEAMSCGSPVITAGVTAMPEICGDAVLYCDPNNPQDIADKIRVLKTNEELRKHYKQKGLKRSGLFSWDKSGQGIWNAAEQLFSK
jgi:glycosyltransferase involved in cell wall biosynthesis